MAKEKSEIKIRLHHINDGDCLEVWEAQAEEGKHKLYLGRDTFHPEQSWRYLCDAPDGCCERGWAVENSIELVICDKQWNELFRDGNNSERFPDSFPTFDEINSSEWGKIRDKYPCVTKDGFIEWIEAKMPTNLNDLDRLNWVNHRSEVTNTEILHQFTWVGENYAVFRLTRKHTLCHAIWYVYVTCKENRDYCDSYSSFIGYEYGEVINNER